jgi:RNA recognition motif-containing protein
MEQSKILIGENMKKKLFVGNLSWKVTEETLRPMFEAFGTVVSVKVIVDQFTGKSKGFGFVEMETAEGAERALAELNEKPLLDRNMRISLAQERTERPREGGGGGGGGGSRDRGDRGGYNKPYGNRQERSYQS